MTVNSPRSDADAEPVGEPEALAAPAREHDDAPIPDATPAATLRASLLARVRRGAVTLLALLLILLFAGGLRLYNVNWDDGHHLHPDERFMAIVASAIRFPANPLDYFDTRRSTLNPYNNKQEAFAYGMAPLFVARFVADRLDMASYDNVSFVGRWLSALSDVGTVLLVFLIGRMLYSSAVGLVAAALLATTVTHIQLSHFFAVDTFLAFATTLAIYAAYRVWLRGGYLNVILLGFACGLALSTKLSAALLAPVVLLAVAIPSPGERTRRTISEMAVLLMICGLVSFLTYRVGEPYSFAGPSFFGIFPNLFRFEDLNRWVKISSGEIEVPFMIQWANTPNPRFALTNMVLWGFGPAAGLTALAGMVVAGLQMVRWKQHSIHLLLVVWAAINLGYFGFQFAKFMRYFLPAYPVLAVLSAYLLVQALPRFVARVRAPAGLQALVRVGLPAVVLLLTGLYALAFVNIYNRPNTRIAASEWIYANIPRGSALGVEHWDDSLPLRLRGFEPKFTDVSMNLYDDDNPDKIRKVVANLEQVDYLILASNRLYGSIPRLPKRYPATIEYYRALFDGRLGFDLVAKFDSHPNLFGVTLDSSGAQEDFTVYDHPTVLIFKKSQRFQVAQVRDIFAGVSLENVERTKPVEATARKGLLLSAREWEHVQDSGTWSEMFTLDGSTTSLALPIWLLVVTILGLVAYPLCWLLLPGLADRGYGVVRTFGLVLVAYIGWLAASVGLGTWGRGLLIVALLLMAFGSLIVLRTRWHAFAADLRTVWPRLLTVELAFLVSFVVILLVRMSNPDLWHPNYGGEKPMDFAYLNAVVKTPSFPPYDPWFAGGFINYYYYGFVLVAALIHLTGVPPHIAYNLAVSTIFALTAGGAFSVALSIVSGPGGRRGLTRGAVVAGALSAVTVVLLGNLDGALQLLEVLWKAGGDGIQSGLPLVTGLSRALFGLAAMVTGGNRLSFDFWRSTRFIGPEEPGPIHEFPYFTFLYGDLHAHMISMPLQVLVVAVALQAVRLLRPEIQAFPGLPRADTRRAALLGMVRPLALVALAGLLIGTLRTTNTWELPTYLAMVGLMAFIAARPGKWTSWLGAAAGAGGALAAAYVLSSILFAPFLARYELFYSGVVKTPTPTRPGQFLLINGALLFVVLSWVVYTLARSALVARAVEGRFLFRAPAPGSQYLATFAPAITLRGEGQVSSAAMAVLLAMLALWSVGYGTVGLLVLSGALAGALALYRRTSREIAFVCGILLAALGAFAFPEILSVKGDVGRMNTVFKFFLQAWILLSILAGPAAVLVFRALFQLRLAPVSALGLAAEREPHAAAPELITPESVRSGARYAWLTVAVLLAASCAVYPVLATRTKVPNRFEQLPMSLDGMEYMSAAAYRDRDKDLDLPSDYDAIRWMMAHIEGSPVIVEGIAPLYHWGARYSIYTGLPAVLGWDWHQKQQRAGYVERVDQRQRDVGRFYETTDTQAMWSIIDRYDISFIVVGGLERAYYPAAGLAKFERLVDNGFEVVYRQGSVTIYRVARP
ncbi:MAG: glycosyltransferase family 39 protein [Chloroflexi bacterium]|nr:glycosyltransferase family 39 protein [Chloroflexota bacterium]